MSVDSTLARTRTQKSSTLSWSICVDYAVKLCKQVKSSKVFTNIALLQSMILMLLVRRKQFRYEDYCNIEKWWLSLSSIFMSWLTLLTEILQSLKILSGNSRYGKIEPEHDHTLNWIWSPKVAQGPGFLEWLQNEQPLFWISGKPGAGKSTLMKFIHGHKRTLEVITSKNSQRVILISFFFHELGTSSERTFTGLLHALMS